MISMPRQIIVPQGLPKTGQTTVYEAGDDGTNQAGWFKGLLDSQNLTRFLERTIGGDIIVYDRATGLYWPKDATGSGGGAGQYWTTHLTTIAALDFAGFDDWRMPNVLEFISIWDYGHDGPIPYTSIFSNFDGGESYFSCTTYITNVIMALGVQAGYVINMDKETGGRWFAVRGGLE